MRRQERGDRGSALLRLRSGDNSLSVGDKPDCLTDEQVGVVREEYRGPHDPDGHSLFDGGEPYGSELAWANWLVMPAADTAAPADTYSAALGLDYLNDMALLPNPPGRYSLDKVPFTLAMHDQLRYGRHLQRYRPRSERLSRLRRKDYYLS